jgi:hypothetical protein
VGRKADAGDAVLLLDITPLIVHMDSRPVCKKRTWAIEESRDVLDDRGEKSGHVNGVTLMKRSIVFVAVTALAASAGLAASKGRAKAQLACGPVDERLAVKTLQDQPHLLPNRMTTVKWLDHRTPPEHRKESRMAFEYHVFTVVASVTAVHLEGDSDYHVLLKEHGWPMITESPAPECTSRAKLYYRQLMARVHKIAHVCAKARITGVAFFDTEHGQTGVAPNGIELHPILRFRCLTR